jgi:SWI/SNF-related matrix-associated actin-dependent regulator 1 of chromatin subfamily A
MLQGVEGTMPRNAAWIEGSEIVVDSPYSADAVVAARAIPGRFWDGANRRTRFPGWRLTEVTAWISRYFPGLDVSGLNAPIGDAIKVEGRGAFFAVTTPYDVDFVSAVKKLPDCSWPQDQEIWLVPKDRARDLLGICKRIFGSEPSALLAAIAEHEGNRALATAVSSEDKIILPGGELFPFQVTGVKFLESKGMGLISDDMGLGKSIQTIAYMYRNKEISLPAIVVCPASVKVNWVREITRWSGRQLIAVVADVKKLESQIASEKPDVLVLNYETLPKLVDATGAVSPVLVRWGLKCIVFDEAHTLKNAKSQRSKAALALVRHTGGRVIELTGTPLLNRPGELWHLLHLLDGEAWGNYGRFRFRYCGPEQNRYGWTFDGASNTQELRDRLIGHYMVRRLKKDVLKELPPKLRSYVPVRLDKAGMKECRDLFGTFAARLMAEDGSPLKRHADTLAAMNELRQAVGMRKVPVVASWLVEALETTGKVLVFAYHHAVTDALIATLAESGVRVSRVDGRDDLATRQSAIDGFQAGDIQVLVCGIKTAGVGLTLTATDQVVFIERAWRPADHEQAEDRAYRIGQDKCVNVWFFDAEDTIDDDMRDLQDSKRGVISAIVDGGDAPNETEESVAMQVALRVMKRYQER